MKLYAANHLATLADYKLPATMPYWPGSEPVLLIPHMCTGLEWFFFLI